MTNGTAKGGRAVIPVCCRAEGAWEVRQRERDQATATVLRRWRHERGWGLDAAVAIARAHQGPGGDWGVSKASLSRYERGVAETGDRGPRIAHMPRAAVALLAHIYGHTPEELERAVETEIAAPLSAGERRRTEERDTVLALWDQLPPAARRAQLAALRALVADAAATDFQEETAAWFAARIGVAGPRDSAR